MDFAEMVSLTKFILNFNDGQADQDYSDTRIKQVLNLVYREEINKAKQEGSKRYFRAFREETWESGEVTFSLPTTISKAALDYVEDVTNVDPGVRLHFSERGRTGDVFWKDRNTLQWGSAGPGEDKTLRFFYYAQPETLTADDQQPELIPIDFHELLPWAAACWLRAVGDEASPGEWRNKRDEIRLDFWKHVSRGRPVDDVPWINQAESDLESGEVL